MNENYSIVRETYRATIVVLFFMSVLHYAGNNGQSEIEKKDHQEEIVKKPIKLEQMIERQKNLRVMDKKMEQPKSNPLTDVKSAVKHNWPPQVSKEYRGVNGIQKNHDKLLLSAGEKNIDTRHLRTVSATLPVYNFCWPKDLTGHFSNKVPVEKSLELGLDGKTVMLSYPESVEDGEAVIPCFNNGGAALKEERDGNETRSEGTDLVASNDSRKKDDKGSSELGEKTEGSIKNRDNCEIAVRNKTDGEVSNEIKSCTKVAEKGKVCIADICSTKEKNKLKRNRNEILTTTASEGGGDPLDSRILNVKPEILNTNDEIKRNISFEAKKEICICHINDYRGAKCLITRGVFGQLSLGETGNQFIQNLKNGINEVEIFYLPNSFLEADGWIFNGSLTYFNACLKKEGFLLKSIDRENKEAVFYLEPSTKVEKFSDILNSHLFFETLRKNVRKVMNVENKKFLERLTPKEYKRFLVCCDGLKLAENDKVTGCFSRKEVFEARQNVEFEGPFRSLKISGGGVFSVSYRDGNRILQTEKVELKKGEEREIVNNTGRMIDKVKIEQRFPDSKLEVEYTIEADDFLNNDNIDLIEELASGWILKDGFFEKNLKPAINSKAFDDDEKMALLSFFLNHPQVSLPASKNDLGKWEEENYEKLQERESQKERIQEKIRKKKQEKIKKKMMMEEEDAALLSVYHFGEDFSPRRKFIERRKWFPNIADTARSLLRCASNFKEFKQSLNHFYKLKLIVQEKEEAKVKKGENAVLDEDVFYSNSLFY